MKTECFDVDKGLSTFDPYRNDPKPDAPSGATMVIAEKGLLAPNMLKKCTVYIHERKPGEASFRVVIRGKDAELITARMMETALRADELNLAGRVDAMEKEMRDMRGAISRIKEVI